MPCHAALPYLLRRGLAAPRPSAPPPALSPAAGCEGAAPETLIFVDVDGVLNVGIGDPGQSAMEFSATNVERALAAWDRRNDLSPPMRSCVERITSVHSRNNELVSTGDSLSQVAVGRLAKLILAAGDRCAVVLSSTWRLPRHVARVRRLEQALSRHLGRPFAFHDRTSLKEDHTADARLRCVGDYVAKHCAKAGPARGNLRVLMLEDFHVSPLGWKCDGRIIDAAADVEEYLRARAPDSVRVSSKLVHTYDEWLTGSGMRVQIGCGLTSAHVRDALSFLGGAQVEAELVDTGTKAGNAADPQMVVSCAV